MLLVQVRSLCLFGGGGSDDKIEKELAGLRLSQCIPRRRLHLQRLHLAVDPGAQPRNGGVGSKVGLGAAVLWAV